MTLKIEIEIPNVAEPLCPPVWEREIASDVLAWLHSDESGFAGEPEMTVTVNGWSKFAKSSSYAREVTGESLTEVGAS